MALRRHILALGVTAALIIAAGTALIIWAARAKALDDGESRLTDLSVVLAEQTARSISQIDSILLGLGPEVARQAGTPPEVAEPALHAALVAYIRVPQLQSLVAFDAHGRSIASNTAFPMRQIDASDRGYFRVHRDRITAGLHINAVQKSRVTGLPSITLSRPVVGQRSELLGVVAAFVETSYLTDLYRSLNLGPDGGVTLYRRDGTPVVGIGTGGDSLPLAAEARPSSPGEVRVTRLDASASSRVIAAAALPDLPLTLGVSSTTEFALRGWRHDAWVASALGGLAAAFVLALAAAIHQRLQSDARLRADMREGAARLDAIVQSAMDAIVTVGADQRIVLFNAAAVQMFGCDAAQAIGTPLHRFIPERFRARHREHVEQFGRTGDTARRMGPQTALAALRADGTEFPIEASISQATVHGQKLYTVILRDISARVRAEAEIRRAHEQQRELAAAMHGVREAERTRIARELHDELGQALTGLKMDVELLARTAPAERADLLERVAAMRELLDATVATTRRISADLRPLVLDDLGLGAAAEWLVQSVVQRSRLACELDVDPACAQLGEPYASALFRIMQESLTNTVRHARARRVEVRLQQVDGVAVLTVSDDGIGMDGTARAKPRSFGLRGISERALLLGGSVNITSEPGAGTDLVARIPIDAGRGKDPT
jgi:PAS domain S-box-containing protein